MKLHALGILALALCSTSAQAWDGEAVGRITAIEVPESGGNYEAMVSTLTSAYIAGKTVDIFTIRDSGTSYCRIGHLIMY